MRLGTVTLSATLSAALLSGCSFVGGQSSNFKNPFAKQKAGHLGQYAQQAVNQRCQIASPRQPIPRGCRPEQVTIGTAGQGQFGQGAYGAQGGFPQQPQFGQPQYTSGAYGDALGQTAAVAHHTGGTNKRKRKPKLRGSLSLGLERSIDGDFLDFNDRPDLGIGGYDPQDFNEGFQTGTQASGSVTTTTYTANDFISAAEFEQSTASEISDLIRADGGFESATQSALDFNDVWLTPLTVKGGLEYIVNDNTTVFANGGYSYAAGNAGSAGSVTATLYRETSEQPTAPLLDATGAAISGQFGPNGDPLVAVNFIPNQEIASFELEASDLERFDLEVGARHYFKPIVKSDGYRTVTPFVGASVGVSRVNSVDVRLRQTQVFFQQAFESGGSEGAETFIVPSSGDSTRLYDAQWLPQGQLNVGAEWQVTPKWALALESGVRIQDSRDLADFTDDAGNLIEGGNGDTNISIPLTLRGSINF